MVILLVLMTISSSRDFPSVAPGIPHPLFCSYSFPCVVPSVWNPLIHPVHRLSSFPSSRDHFGCLLLHEVSLGTPENARVTSVLVSFLSHCRLSSVVSLSMGGGPWPPSLVLSRMHLYKLKGSKACCWQGREWLSVKSLHICPNTCSLQHIVLGHELTWWGYWMWVYVHVGFGNASPIS